MLLTTLQVSDKEFSFKATRLHLFCPSHVHISNEQLSPESWLFLRREVIPFNLSLTGNLRSVMCKESSTSDWDVTGSGQVGKRYQEHPLTADATSESSLKKGIFATESR